MGRNGWRGRDREEEIERKGLAGEEEGVRKGEKGVGMGGMYVKNGEDKKVETVWNKRKMNVGNVM